MNGMSNGSLLLEEKVLNAVKRMRCSRRSGVIFLAMITAIAWPTPHHRLRRSLSSRRSLLVDSFASCCTPPRLIPAPNHAPVARRCNRRGLAKPDHRGKMKNRPGGVYSRPSDSSFSLPRGRGGSAASQFNSIDFHVTHRFFVTFFAEESNVPFFPSPPLTLPYTRPSSAKKKKKGAVIHG